MTWYQRRGSKYNNISHVYNGIAYHSKREAGHAAGLDLLKKAGEIKEWERQVKISLDVNGYHIANYYVDFRVVNKDDSIELHEVKGMELETWKLKRKLLEATYLQENPGIKYIVIK